MNGVESDKTEGGEGYLMKGGGAGKQKETNSSFMAAEILRAGSRHVCFQRLFTGSNDNEDV